MGHTAITILICISGWLTDADAHAVQQAAHAHGFKTYWAEKGEDLRPQHCSALFMRSDNDFTGQWRAWEVIGFDDSRRLEAGRAGRLITEWTNNNEP